MFLYYGRMYLRMRASHIYCRARRAAGAGVRARGSLTGQLQAVANLVRASLSARKTLLRTPKTLVARGTSLAARIRNLARREHGDACASCGGCSASGAGWRVVVCTAVQQF